MTVYIGYDHPQRYRVSQPLTCRARSRRVPSTEMFGAVQQVSSDVRGCTGRVDSSSGPDQSQRRHEQTQPGHRHPAEVAQRNSAELSRCAVQTPPNGGSFSTIVDVVKGTLLKEGQRCQILNSQNWFRFAKTDLTLDVPFCKRPACDH